MLVLAIVLPVVLVRQPPQPSATPPENAPKARVNHQSTRVSPATRRAVDNLLDRFVPAALTHRSMATAWQLSGPELTGGTTLRQWKDGTSPIPYYPVGGKTFHTWRTIDAGPGYVVFNLLVHPLRDEKVGSWVFSGEAIRRHSQWVVNRFYTIAVFRPPTKTGRHEVGPADYQASAPSAASATPPVAHGEIGKSWILVIVGIIALVVLFPVAFFVGSVTRARRARKRYESGRSRDLPPLRP